ncbi:unnamed protein product [Phytophthora fragariaefolia]|uniref:Unnamed protein product n=1 Tax=Phytophthora fragariaefolia TaxID=1490495 RepID=A0A9W6WW20_9STRA|nr:unnamed protein product [Phytophthora fragariaefolia]
MQDGRTPVDEKSGPAAVVRSLKKRSVDGKSKVSHVEFLKRLHLELIQLHEEDWAQLLRKRDLQPTPTKRRQDGADHIPFQTNEWRKGNSEATRKRRQRACKVCSVLKPPSTLRGGETTYYCGACKLKTASKIAETHESRRDDYLQQYLA